MEERKREKESGSALFLFPLMMAAGIFLLLIISMSESREDREKFANRELQLWAMLYEAKQMAGVPILVGGLPDGTYERVEEDEYAFFRRRSDGKVLGIQAKFGSLPNAFQWKDGKFLEE